MDCILKGRFIVRNTLAVLTLLMGLSTFIIGMLSTGDVGPSIILFLVFFALSRNDSAKDLDGVNRKASNISKSKMTKFNKAVRAYYKSNDVLSLSDNIHLKPRSLANNRNVDLEVYYNDEYICQLHEFSNYFSGTYGKMIDEILEITAAHTTEEVVSPKVQVEKVEPKKETVKKESQADNAEYFIKVIDELNIDIEKAEITNDLYQTTAMLKQISLIETRYPENKDKLVKLYQYYLPILVNILSSYVKLMRSNSKHDEIEAIETKLRKTIVLVNEALKTITMQLCEEDIIDLNSDMSVLETILRKDGLVKDGTIYESRVNESAH